MSKNPQLLLNQVVLNRKGTVFEDHSLDLSFSKKRYGLVGDNGIGKTTVMQLLAGEILPERGRVQLTGRLCYCPQSHVPYLTSTIAKAMDVANQLAAYHRIQAGSIAEEDFILLDGAWDLKSRIEQVLLRLSLGELDLAAPFSHLSGGERTKVLLARAMLSTVDFLLLDEPTNNLDKVTRDILYDYLSHTTQGIIVVSHDRMLLNQMDEIIELSRQGVALYGGHFDDYQQQKALEAQAVHKDYQDAKQALKNTQYSLQQSKEKHQKSAARGKKAYRDGKVDKLTALSKKGRSEKSKHRATVQEKALLAREEAKLFAAKEKLEFKSSIDMSLPASHVPQGKQIIMLEHCYFRYPGMTHWFIEDFSMIVQGPERVAIQGPNGSGKSTLIKLIRGQLHMSRGSFKLGVETVAYLDQSLSFLKNELSIIDNYLHINPKATAFEAHSALAALQFRSQEANKTVADLSGGERMRAGLAITLLSQKVPQLLILDEPTNHLDLRSIAAMEVALQAYEGALLIVSHDEVFCQRLGITREVSLLK